MGLIYKENKGNLRDFIVTTGLVVSNEIQIAYPAHARLKYDRWALKSAGNIFHTYRSYVCHSIAMHEFKLQVSSGNTQIRAKSSGFLPCQFEMWQIISKDNRMPRLRHAKLCASVCSRLWSQPGVTVRKLSIWAKIGIFCPMWPWNLTDDLANQQGTFCLRLQALCIIS